ncbi:MAG TPA: glycosyltransferase [Gaiellaceae bacterium]|nr:glycosyltransferase [Gaiellaceae bacterium]
MGVANALVGLRAPGSEPGRPLVGHVVPEYLPRSATFIHTLLRNQRRFRPLVLAQSVANLDEFPVEQALALGEDGFAGRLVEEARRGGCVLLHAHFGWSGRDAVPAERELNVPLVTTFYGRDLSEPGRARFRHPYRRLFSRGAAFVVEGPFMADRLAETGAARDRIRVVPIGIDIGTLPFSTRARGDVFVAVQAARFVEKKGLDLSLRAFAAARRELGPSELWLVGDGPLRDELEALAGALGVSDAVRFPGLVAQDEYRRIAARADVALQPSRTASDGDSEGGAPTVILEYQALGIPVVATRHADIPFVVPRPDELAPEDDVDALAGALVRVAAEDPDERVERLQEARSFVERRHDARQTAAMVEDVYEEVLQ